MVLRRFYEFSWARRYPNQDAAWRNLYDELDQERIAIYPIDARGLLADTTAQMVVAKQHLVMSDVGQATGGQAFFNNNGLEEITDHLLESDGSFYTLTYSPDNLRFDNKWHKVRVEVDGAPYQLSYRRGYFADGSARQKDPPSRARTRLLWNGEKLEVSELRDRPIIFQARVVPTSDSATANFDSGSGSLPLHQAKKGSVPFLIRYTLPINALTIRDVDGTHKIVWGVAAIGLDRDGTMVAAQSRGDYDDPPRPIYFVAALPSPSWWSRRLTCRRAISFSIWAYGTQLTAAPAASILLFEAPNPAKRQEPTSHD